MCYRNTSRRRCSVTEKYFEMLICLRRTYRIMNSCPANGFTYVAIDPEFLFAISCTCLYDFLWQLLHDDRFKCARNVLIARLSVYFNLELKCCWLQSSNWSLIEELNWIFGWYEDICDEGWNRTYNNKKLFKRKWTSLAFVSNSNHSKWIYIFSLRPEVERRYYLTFYKKPRLDKLLEQDRLTTEQHFYAYGNAAFSCIPGYW